MFADNNFMLCHLCAADESRHYFACLDLVQMGTNEMIQDIRYFIKNDAAPLDDYLCVKIFRDSYAVIYAATRDSALLCECFTHIAGTMRDIAEIELRTPYAEIFAYDCFLQYFEIDEPIDAEYPVYFMHTRAELSAIPSDNTVSISLASETECREIADKIHRGTLKSKDLSPDMFRHSPLFRDTRVYLLRADGRLAGFLRAECGFSNIYNIGWLFVLPEFRKRGYAVQLVHSFAMDCFENGFLPHYGFAVSPQSVKVAEACGFQCDRTPHVSNMIRLR